MELWRAGAGPSLGGWLTLVCPAYVTWFMSAGSATPMQERYLAKHQAGLCRLCAGCPPSSPGRGHEHRRAAQGSAPPTGVTSSRDLEAARRHRHRRRQGLGRAYALHLGARGPGAGQQPPPPRGEADADTSAGQDGAAIRAAGGRPSPTGATWAIRAAAWSWSSMRRPRSAGWTSWWPMPASTRRPASSSSRWRTSGDLRHQLLRQPASGACRLAGAHRPGLGPGGADRLQCGPACEPRPVGILAAKAAVIGLAKALAIEGARREVRVNVIAPYMASRR